MSSVCISNYFLPDETERLLHILDFENTEKTWYQFDNLSFYHEKLLSGLPKGLCDLSKAVGIEQWTHNHNNIPGMHYDKDEDLFHKTKEVRFPLCSIILYVKVENLLGAKLYVQGESTIVPETGKVVYLQSGILHGVLKHIAGTRLTVNLNIWDYDINNS